MKKILIILFALSVTLVFVGYVQATDNYFFDDFNDNDADGWISVPGYPPGTYGNWRVENGIVVEDMGRDHFMFLLDNHIVSNQTVSAKVLWHDNGQAGVTIWYKDDANWIQVYHRYRGGVAVLEKVAGVETMTIYPNDLWERVWMTMKLEANSQTGEIAVYLDDEYLFTHTVGINAAKSGLSGLNSSNAGGDFDDFLLIDTSGPKNIDECKKGGWMTFNNPAFKNQGQCVSYVVSNKNK